MPLSEEVKEALKAAIKIRFDGRYIYIKCPVPIKEAFSIVADGKHIPARSGLPGSAE